MRLGALHHGAALGFGLPWLVLAPAVFAGPVLEILARGATFLLLPSFALLMVPGAFAGWVAAQSYAERRSTWRFGAGLFLGASLAATVLFWSGGHDYTLLHRAVMSLFGGPFLAGFWIWLGFVLGAAVGYARVERQEETPEPLSP